MEMVAVDDVSIELGIDGEAYAVGETEEKTVAAEERADDRGFFFSLRQTTKATQTTEDRDGCNVISVSGESSGNNLRDDKEHGLSWWYSSKYTGELM